MTELPRYHRREIAAGLYDDLDIELVLWADVSSRLQQLETENAQLRENTAGTPAYRLDWLADELGKRWRDSEPLSAAPFEPRFLEWLDEQIATVQQLEQEKATLQSQNDELRYYNKAYIETLGVSQDQRVAELSAALAETREALHSLQEKYDALTRGDIRVAISDASVPQGQARGNQ